jgi:uncharacterized protein (TIGR02118 family)
MIKVSVLYPNQKGSRFDMSYYCSRHIPLVRQLLGPALKNVAVDEGIAGMTPGSSATYIALGHLYFESVAAFQEAFTPHAAAILADIPNYTDTQPTVQISTVKI